MASEEEEMPVPLKKRKSGPSRKPAFVRFINQSSRNVDLIWLGYEHSAVRYPTMPPASHVDINTFVGHPWIFRDSDNGNKMVVRQQEVYMPEMGIVNGFPVRLLANITIPVYTLRERCLQVVRQHVDESALRQLEIPNTLITDLSQKNDPDDPEVSHQYQDASSQDPPP